MAIHGYLSHVQSVAGEFRSRPHIPEVNRTRPFTGHASYLPTIAHLKVTSGAIIVVWVYTNMAYQLNTVCVNIAIYTNYRLMGSILMLYL